jgi:putative inorganic carbon (HCO3(-)) transporter
MHIHLGIEGILPWALYGAMWLGFLLSMLWRPQVGLYILAFALPMQTGRYKLQPFFLGSQFIDILIFGVVLGLLFHGRSIIQKLPSNRILLVVAVFLYFSPWEGSFFASTPLPLWITDPRFSNCKNYVEMFFLSMLVTSTLTKKRQIQTLIAVMCLSALVVNRNYYSLLSDRDLSHFSYDVRDAGLLGYAGVNGLAAFEAMFCTFVLGILTFVRNIAARIGLVLVLVSGIYCLLFSFSRGGYIGFLCGMITVGVLRSRKYLVLALVVIFGWQVLLPTSVQQRISMTTEGSGNGQFDSSSEERLTLWRDALDMFERNPVTGTGFNTYEFMHRVGSYQDTHNYYLKVLAETGLVGMILFLFLLRMLFTSGWQLYRSTNDLFWSAVATGFTAMVICAIFLNFFGDRWSYQQVDGYLWMLLGIVSRGQIETNQLEIEGFDEDLGNQITEAAEEPLTVATG